MKEGNIELLDLDFEYKLWKSKLHYFIKELELLKGRVHVLDREMDGFHLRTQDAHLINNQMLKIKKLENRIKTQEREMALFAEDYPINQSHTHYFEHELIRTEMETISANENYIMEEIYPLLCFPMQNA